MFVHPGECTEKCHLYFVYSRCNTVKVLEKKINAEMISSSFYDNLKSRITGYDASKKNGDGRQNIAKKGQKVLEKKINAEMND